MRKTENKLYLEEIVEFCRHIEEYLTNVEMPDFLNNRMLQDALVRKIEIIGEAAKSLTKEFCEQNPQIPWREITRMRDKVIHHYFRVDLETVWKTAKIDIPVLKSEISKILKSLS